MTIKPANMEDAQTIAQIVALSNQDVAEKFELNRDNNPKHPSFYDTDWVMSDFARGEEYFIYEISGRAVGCVAFEQPNLELGYLNRLSVLPAYRNRGIGKELTEFVIKYSRDKGISEISIGIIAKHTALKNWYKKLGFTENGIKAFPHLPFDVLFMKYEIR